MFIEIASCCLIQRNNLALDPNTQKLFIGHFVVRPCQYLPVPTGNGKSGKRCTVKGAIFRHVHPLKEILNEKKQLNPLNYLL